MRKIADCIDHGCVGMGLGYATAWLTEDGKRYTTTKHRVVFYNTHGYLPEVVMHTCDNARCINPEHLVAGTHKSNSADKFAKGRQGDARNFGEGNGRAILTDAECDFIRKLYVKGSRETGCPALARKYKCGTSQIHRIVSGHQRTVA